MSDWRPVAIEMRKSGLRNSQIARELGLHPSWISKFFNYQADSLTADDDFVVVREPRVPRRIIKDDQSVMALAKLFAAGFITREELSKGIAA